MTSPRSTHHRSAEVVRAALDAAGVPHFTRYGKHDNVLVVIQGVELPIMSARGSMETGTIDRLPTHIYTKARKYGTIILADPDLGIVEVRRRETHQFEIRDVTADTLCNIEYRVVWVRVPLRTLDADLRSARLDSYAWNV
jgi:hypothetical protein